MKIEFRALVDELGEQLVNEHRFQRTGYRFIRDDGVMRSAWFKRGTSTRGEFHFDILFDLGLSGLSTFSSEAQAWVVRADASGMRSAPGQRRLKLRLTGDDEQLASGLRQLCSVIYDDFLLRHDTSEDLYRWVRQSAISFSADHTVQDDFARFELQPWNAVVRLELAAVYAAYLGDLDDATQLVTLAAERARSIGRRDAVVKIQQSVADAAHTAGYRWPTVDRL